MCITFANVFVRAYYIMSCRTLTTLKPLYLRLQVRHRVLKSCVPESGHYSDLRACARRRRQFRAYYGGIGKKGKVIITRPSLYTCSADLLSVRRGRNAFKYDPRESNTVGSGKRGDGVQCARHLFFGKRVSVCVYSALYRRAVISVRKYNIINY